MSNKLHFDPRFIKTANFAWNYAQNLSYISLKTLLWAGENYQYQVHAETELPAERRLG